MNEYATEKGEQKLLAATKISSGNSEYQQSAALITLGPIQ
jgi:hypothetical protein